MHSTNQNISAARREPNRRKELVRWLRCRPMRRRILKIVTVSAVSESRLWQGTARRTERACVWDWRCSACLIVFSRHAKKRKKKIFLATSIFSQNAHSSEPKRTQPPALCSRVDNDFRNRSTRLSGRLADAHGPVNLTQAGHAEAL